VEKPAADGNSGLPGKPWQLKYLGENGNLSGFSGAYKFPLTPLFQKGG
jgi:hypothetical protein